jgi:uncharacterized membrane protein
MPDLRQSLVFLHVLAAFVFVAGLIGREVCRRQADQTRDILQFRTLILASGRFENLMVIPGSIAVLIFGLVAGWALGWPIFGVLQGATQNWLFVSMILFLSTIPLVRFVFLPRGRLFEAALQDAVDRVEVTGELRARLNDPVVAAAHVYEGVVVFLIIFLMVVKPF